MKLWRFFKGSILGAVLISFMIGASILPIFTTFTLRSFFFGGVFGLSTLIICFFLYLAYLQVLEDWERVR